MFFGELKKFFLLWVSWNPYSFPDVHNWVKDLALVALLLVAVGGCWLAYVQNKYSQTHLKKVMKDLDTLQKAEDSLVDLQKR